MTNEQWLKDCIAQAWYMRANMRKSRQWLDNAPSGTTPSEMNYMHYEHGLAKQEYALARTDVMHAKQELV